MEGQTPRYVTLDEAAGFYLDVPEETSLEQVQARIDALVEQGVDIDKLFIDYRPLIEEANKEYYAKREFTPNRADRRAAAREKRKK